MPFCAFFHEQPKHQDGAIFVNTDGMRPYLSKLSYGASKWAQMVRLMQKSRLNHPRNRYSRKPGLLVMSQKRPFWPFLPVISETGWTSPRKVPLGIRLRSTRPSYIRNIVRKMFVLPHFKFPMPGVFARASTPPDEARDFTTTLVHGTSALNKPGSALVCAIGSQDRGGFGGSMRRRHAITKNMVLVMSQRRLFRNI